VDQLIKQSLATDTFNNPNRPVDPKFGDVYIYRCGAAGRVCALDRQKWKHDGVLYRSHKQVPDREFHQATYIKSLNHDEKKLVLTDSLNGVKVLHYRHKVNTTANRTTEKIKSSKNKASFEGLDKDLSEDIKTLETNYVASVSRLCTGLESVKELGQQLIEIEDYMTEELNYADRISHLLDQQYSQAWRPDANTEAEFPILCEETSECLDKLHASHSRYLQFKERREKTAELLETLYQVTKKELEDIERVGELLSNCEKIGWFRMQMEESHENLLERFENLLL
jgi:hypothetical protein